VSQFIEISKLEVGLEDRVIGSELENVGEIGVTFGASVYGLSKLGKVEVAGELGGG
jgi:hypothetical protein